MVMTTIYGVGDGDGNLNDVKWKKESWTKNIKLGLDMSNDKYKLM